MESVSSDVRKRVHQFINGASQIDGVATHRILGIWWNSDEECYIVSTWNDYHGYADSWSLWEPTDSNEQDLSIAGFYGEN